MRLIIPCEFWTPGACGVETFTLAIVRELLSEVDRLILVLPSRKLSYLRGQLPDSAGLKLEPLEQPGHGGQQALLRKAALAAFRYTGDSPLLSWLSALWKRTITARLRELVAQHKASHCLYTYTIAQSPPEIDIPLAACVSDLRWHYRPSDWPAPANLILERFFAQWLNKVKLLMPVSEMVAAEIRQVFPFYQGRLKTVPHGTDPFLLDRLSQRSTATAQDKQETPIFYYPALVSPHKNHLRLLQAAALLAKHGENFRIFLSGRDTDRLLTRASPYKEIEECRQFYTANISTLTGRIQCLGNISRDRVYDLYSSCSAVVLPSLYEGFGLPLLEALAAGSYVICSRIPAYLEQIGRYDLDGVVALFEPESTSDLAEQMQIALAQGRDRQNSIERLREQLSQWTWQHAARAYFEELSKLH